MAPPLMLSLSPQFEQWLPPEVLLELGYSGVRLIAKADLRTLLEHRDQPLASWCRRAIAAGLQVWIDLPGRKPIVTSELAESSIRVGDFATFVDDAVGCEAAIINCAALRQIRVINLSAISPYLQVGKRISIADGEFEFVVVELSADTAIARCVKRSVAYTANRSMTVMQCDIRYQCPTASELDLMRELDAELYSGVVISFCSSVGQIAALEGIGIKRSLLIPKLESYLDAATISDLCRHAKRVLIGRDDLRSSVGSRNVLGVVQLVAQTAHLNGCQLYVASLVFESLCYRPTVEDQDAQDVQELQRLGVSGIMLSGCPAVRRLRQAALAWQHVEWGQESRPPF